MKSGFTLIELLAVIVILAIIVLIATPIILGIISDTKKKTFEQSINGIVRSALDESVLNLKGEDILYKYNKNNWEENKLDIDGQIPKYVEIKVNKEGKVRYAITDGVYCATKEYDSKINIKNISNTNNEKQILEEYCKLDPSTDESCFKYSIESDKKITIEDYYCYERNHNKKPVITDVIIPNEIGGIPVVSIGNGAFVSDGLTSVIIPDSVTEIGSSAFDINYLTDVIIPEGVTSIGERAFAQNALKNIIIPNSVTQIGRYAFFVNELTSVTISNNVTYIGVSVFARNQLTSVVIPNSVTNIEDYAFYDNKLTNLTIPNSVKRIGRGAFFKNSLKNVSIPSSVTYIGTSAFTDNKLSDSQAFIYNRNYDGSINYKSLNSYGGAKRDNVIIPEETNGVKLTTLGYESLSNNSLTSVTIPNSVTSISEGVFKNNLLKTINIPNSVTKIGKSAFYNNELTSVIIPNSVIEIGELAFSSNKLKNIVIPSSVTSIGNQAFTKNELPDNQAFIYNKKSDGSTDYSSLNSYGGVKKENVIIPEETNGVKLITLGTNSFSENKLISVTIPDSVEIIKVGAFKLNKLTSVTIGNGVTTIEGGAFSNNNLTSVTIPSSVTSIGGSAFSLNYNLKNVIIKGKSSKNDFASYPTSSPFTCDDTKCITWEP